MSSQSERKWIQELFADVRAQVERFPPKMFIVFGVAILTLLPMPTMAQAQLFVGLYVDAYPDGLPEMYSKGPVTNPNPLTKTLTSSSSSSGSSLTSSAAYGLLQVNGACNANAGAGNEANFDCDPGQSSGPYEYNEAYFSDSLTVTSASPGQQSVNVLVTWVDTLQASVSRTSSCGTEDQITASIYAPIYPGYTTNVEYQANSTVNETWTFQQTFAATVGGSPIQIQDYINLSAAAYGANNSGSGGDCMSSGACTGSLTSQVYVNLLATGAHCTSLSDTTYQQYRPPLSLYLVPHPIYSVIYWPGWATNFVLEECPDLFLNNWTSNTSTVSLVNGTNEVTVPFTNQTMFFRLISSQ